VVLGRPLTSGFHEGSAAKGRPQAPAQTSSVTAPYRLATSGAERGAGPVATEPIVARAYGPDLYQLAFGGGPFHGQMVVRSAAPGGRTPPYPRALEPLVRRPVDIQPTS